MLSDEEKSTMLLEERYATVRSQVRDAYEKCRCMFISVNSNKNEVKRLETSKNFFNKRKVQKNIDDILKQTDDMNQMLADLREYLKPLEREMRELESKLGDRAKYLYGRDDHWWVR